MNARHIDGNRFKNSFQKPIELTEDQKQEITEAFELFDTNKDGMLDFFELKIALRALGFEYKNNEVITILGNHDQNHKGHIKLEDFKKVAGELVSKRDPIEEFRKAFRLFDESGTGKITVSNLRRIAKELGEQMDEEELNAMIEEFDMDQDGAINEQEFINIMTDNY
ncbi:Calcium-binding component of the spindle pole body (SPB) half-bridge [Mycoemilia scoparia]|uniref:Calcium-binding component of the spindle pole body (SPB) half-bridge n=1 Tax=Mycoemilia scoparia TaxID=417184 RepID=A0A9W8DN59_9FUNG|nr:Calcium-binding component of the spindle pole body (SPB) half-bridge [Mycoemilia scoparia]